MAGKMDTSDALEFALCYKKEKDLEVWTDLLNNLSKIKSVFFRVKTGENFNSFFSILLEQILKSFDNDIFEKDDVQFVRLRSLVYLVLGSSHHPSVVSFAEDAFKKYFQDPSSLPNDFV